MSNSSSQPHVLVVGGGPAGTPAATHLAQRGYLVELFERERFPRFHIGESLIQQTYWVLKRLNMLDKMKGSHFVKKYSVQFVNQHGKLSEPFYFVDHKPHESSQTWQVYRQEFDQLMLNNAREHGVDVHEGVRVLEVLFEGKRAVGVRLQREDGREQEVRAKVVVDASGQASGDGWVLCGDAFGFLDPLYSSGVLLALTSGAYAAAAVAEGLRTGDLSGEQLGKWEGEFTRGMDRMRRLVCAYYNGFSFGRF